MSLEEAQKWTSIRIGRRILEEEELLIYRERDEERRNDLESEKGSNNNGIK